MSQSQRFNIGGTEVHIHARFCTLARYESQASYLPVLLQHGVIRKVHTGNVGKLVLRPLKHWNMSNTDGTHRKSWIQRTYPRWLLGLLPGASDALDTRLMWTGPIGFSSPTNLTIGVCEDWPTDARAKVRDEDHSAQELVVFRETRS